MRKIKFVVDTITVNKDTFCSEVFSKNEQEKIERGLREINNCSQKLAYLLNKYVEKGLEFVSAEPNLEKSPHTLFISSDWVGCLIFRKITD